MVAYSFNPVFARQVESWLKLQTVRNERKRHARPGEPVQLYVGMRTKFCRKLVTPDPICIAVQHIVIEVTTLDIGRIEIEGVALDHDAIERFAVADGFAPRWHMPEYPRQQGPTTGARNLMSAFWRFAHGTGVFEQRLIRWATR